MKALILAAGRGLRLRPLTDHCPKPLLPVLNRPCVEYVLERVARAGITHVALNRHHLPNHFPACLGDGSRFGVHLTYTYEPELLAAIGTLKSLADFFGDETALVINGDIVLDLDLREVIRTHQARGGIATMVYKPITTEFIHPVGFDTDGRMRQCRRQPEWTGPLLQEGINVGVNLFEPRVWKEYVPPGIPYELGPQLYPDLIAHDERVYGYPLPKWKMENGKWKMEIRNPVQSPISNLQSPISNSGYWADIGTPEQYLAAHREMLALRLPDYLHGTEVEPGVWWEEEVAVEATARLIPPVCLGRGAKVQAQAQVGPNVVLGAGSVLGAGARMSDSVVHDGVRVPPGTVAQSEIWSAAGRIHLRDEG
jgi:mannose-1-phosphate guanylyltransferase/phosphomannomutase